MAKPKRFMAVADNHGDMQDDVTIAAVLAFREDFDPQIRVHLGDNWDFRNLRKGAGDEEKKDSLEGDWEAGEKFLNDYLSGSGEKVFLFGNHDDRIHQMARSSSGMVRDYAELGIRRMNQTFKKLGVKWFPYDAAEGIYHLGKLKMIHGYHAGTSAARCHANVYGNVIFGHVHTQEVSPVASIEPAEARSIGCLCKRNMDYINAKTGKLKWTNGWAYGYLFDDGSYQLYTTRKINGKFHAATEIKSY